jgi:GNAT superfamily N-acetyltransferase
MSWGPRLLSLGKAGLKKVARTILGDYSAYYVYVGPDKRESNPRSTSKPNHNVRLVDQSAVESSNELLIREQTHYLGAEAYAYGYYVDSRIAGVCIYWSGERYRERNFWPLRDREAKLVQIVTAPSFRRSGIAAELIACSYGAILENGFTRAYARIWHSNTPSLRAFERAGWSRIALVLEINPLRLRRPIRLRFDSRRGRQTPP